MEETSQLGPLSTFIGALDSCLSARAMHIAAQNAGYKTPISSIHAARAALGIGRPRKFERRTAPPESLPPISAFPLPSDETILTNLIVKIGLDRTREVLARLERTFERLEL